MFIAALFTIAKMWKQPKCPTAEWTKKMWCIYIHIYTHKYNGMLLSHKKETMPFAATWMDPDMIIQSEII